MKKVGVPEEAGNTVAVAMNTCIWHRCWHTASLPSLELPGKSSVAMAEDGE